MKGYLQNSLKEQRIAAEKNNKTA